MIKYFCTFGVYLPDYFLYMGFFLSKLKLYYAYLFVTFFIN